VQVNVSMQLGCLSFALSYDAPAVRCAAHSLLACGQGHTTTNVPVQPSAVLLLSGQNFGVTDFSSGAAVGLSAAAVTRWVTDEEMVVRPAKGVGASQPLAVTVGGGGVELGANGGGGAMTLLFQQVGTLSGAVSYDAAAVVGVGNVSNVGRREQVVVMATRLFFPPRRGNETLCGGNWSNCTFRCSMNRTSDCTREVCVGGV